MTVIENRNIRQRELVPPEKLQDTKITIAGVGSVGRQVAMQLAAIGAPDISIYDHDHVAVENLAVQGFHECDLGRPKVEAVADICRAINSEIKITTANRKFQPMQFTGGVFFSCVDGIETRGQIFKAIKNRADLYLDSRMAAEYFRILAVYDKASGEYYETTLFAAGEAYQASCTSKSTIYCASITAGMQVAQFTKWLRGIPLDKDIDVNLLTNEMGVK